MCLYDVFVKCSLLTWLMESENVCKKDDDIIDVDGISDNSCEEPLQQDPKRKIPHESPGRRRKLWMKTPFNSFSSDSTLGSACAKNTENIQALRSKLKVFNFTEGTNTGEINTKDLNIREYFTCFLNNGEWLFLSNLGIV